MTFIKKHKKGLIIFGAIVLILGLIICTFYVAQTYRIQKDYNANALQNPFVNLSELEKEFHLTPAKSYTIHESFKFYEASPPYEPAIYRQVFDAYLLENKDEKTTIALTSKYWYVPSGFTVRNIIGVNALDNYIKYAEVLEDSRFDECYITGFIGSRENEMYSILIIRGQHMMSLDYRGGNLTPEDFLNELDRIL